MTIQAIVVDDNPTNLSVLQKALNLEGIEPVLCEHPDDVAQALNNVDHVDVIFLDLEFPNYDGLELIKEFKQDPRLANVPFVAYTVHTSEQNEALAAGFHSFIGKPINIQAFPDQLKRILSGEPVWDTGT